MIISRWPSVRWAKTSSTPPTEKRRRCGATSTPPKPPVPPPPTKPKPKMTNPGPNTPISRFYKKKKKKKTQKTQKKKNLIFQLFVQVLFQTQLDTMTFHLSSNVENSTCMNRFIDLFLTPSIHHQTFSSIPSFVSDISSP